MEISVALQSKITSPKIEKIKNEQARIIQLLKDKKLKALTGETFFLEDIAITETSSDLFRSILVSLYQHATGKYYLSDLPDYLKEIDEHNTSAPLANLFKKVGDSEIKARTAEEVIKEFDWVKWVYFIKKEYEVKLNVHLLYLNKNNEYVLSQLTKYKLPDSVEVVLYYFDGCMAALTHPRNLFETEENYIRKLELDLIKNKDIFVGFKNYLLALNLDDLKKIPEYIENNLVTVESIAGFVEFFKGYHVNPVQLNKLMSVVNSKLLANGLVDRVKQFILEEFLYAYTDIERSVSSELKLTREVLLKKKSFNSQIEEIEADIRYFEDQIDNEPHMRYLQYKRDWYSFLNQLIESFKINSFKEDENRKTKFIEIKNALDQGKRKIEDCVELLLSLAHTRKIVIKPENIKFYIKEARIICHTQLSTVLSFCQKLVVNNYADRIEVIGAYLSIKELKANPQYKAAINQKRAADQKNIELYITHEVMFDDSLICPSFNVSLQVEKIVCESGVSLDTSGKKVNQRFCGENAKAKDGKNHRSPIGSGTPCGINGDDGEDGEPGESAGNIYINVTTEQGLRHLQLKANGADGENGQHGGDGDNGREGKAGADGCVKKDEVNKVDFGKPGEKGQKGGNGGAGGLGGAGGKPGTILIHISQLDCTKEYKANITAHEGKSGQDGKPGNGGVGGADGDIGKDHVVINSRPGVGLADFLPYGALRRVAYGREEKHGHFLKIGEAGGWFRGVYYIIENDNARQASYVKSKSVNGQVGKNKSVSQRKNTLSKNGINTSKHAFNYANNKVNFQAKQLAQLDQLENTLHEVETKIVAIQARQRAIQHQHKREIKRVAVYQSTKKSQSDFEHQANKFSNKKAVRKTDYSLNVHPYSQLLATIDKEIAAIPNKEARVVKYNLASHLEIFLRHIDQLISRSELSTDDQAQLRDFYNDIFNIYAASENTLVINQALTNLPYECRAIIFLIKAHSENKNEVISKKPVSIWEYTAKKTIPNSIKNPILVLLWHIRSELLSKQSSLDSIKPQRVLGSVNENLKGKLAIIVNQWVFLAAIIKAGDYAKILFEISDSVIVGVNGFSDISEEKALILLETYYSQLLICASKKQNQVQVDSLLRTGFLKKLLNAEGVFQGIQKHLLDPKYAIQIEIALKHIKLSEEELDKIYALLIDKREALENKYFTYVEKMFSYLNQNYYQAYINPIRKTYYEKVNAFRSSVPSKIEDGNNQFLEYIEAIEEKIIRFESRLEELFSAISPSLIITYYDKLKLLVSELIEQVSLDVDPLAKIASKFEDLTKKIIKQLDLPLESVLAHINEEKISEKSFNLVKSFIKFCGVHEECERLQLTIFSSYQYYKGQNVLDAETVADLTSYYLRLNTCINYVWFDQLVKKIEDYLVQLRNNQNKIKGGKVDSSNENSQISLKNEMSKKVSLLEMKVQFIRKNQERLSALSSLMFIIHQGPQDGFMLSQRFFWRHMADYCMSFFENETNLEKKFFLLLLNIVRQEMLQKINLLSSEKILNYKDMGSDDFYVLLEFINILQEIYKIGEGLNFKSQLLPFLIELESMLVKNIYGKIIKCVNDFSKPIGDTVLNNFEMLEKCLNCITEFTVRLTHRKTIYQAIIAQLVSGDEKVEKPVTAEKWGNCLTAIGLSISQCSNLTEELKLLSEFNPSQLYNMFDTLFSELVKIQTEANLNKSLYGYRINGFLLALQSISAVPGLMTKLSPGLKFNEKFAKLQSNNQFRSFLEQPVYQFLQLTAYMYYKNYFNICFENHILISSEKFFLDRYFSSLTSFDEWARFESIIAGRFSEGKAKVDNLEQKSALAKNCLLDWQVVYEKHWAVLVPKDKLSKYLLPIEHSIYEDIITLGELEKANANSATSDKLITLFATISPDAWQESLEQYWLCMLRQQIQLNLGLDETKLKQLFTDLHPDLRAKKSICQFLEKWPQENNVNEIAVNNLNKCLQNLISNEVSADKKAKLKNSVDQFKNTFDYCYAIKNMLNKCYFFVSESQQLIPWFKLMQTWIVGVTKCKDWQIDDVFAFIDCLCECETFEPLNQLFQIRYSLNWRSYFYIYCIEEKILKLLNNKAEGNNRIIFNEIHESLVGLHTKPMILKNLVNAIENSNSLLREEEITDLATLLLSLNKLQLSEAVMHELGQQPLYQWQHYLRGISWLQCLGVDKFEENKDKLFYNLNLLERQVGKEKVETLLRFPLLQQLCKDEPNELVYCLRQFTIKAWVLDKQAIDMLRVKRLEVNSWVNIKKTLEIHSDKVKNKLRDPKAFVELMCNEIDSYNAPIASLLENNDKNLCELLADIKKIKSILEEAAGNYDESIQEWQQDDIANWQQDKKHTPEWMLKNLHEVVAVVMQAVKLIKYDSWDGKYPRDTQLIAVWLLLNAKKGYGRVGQIATGEGKSIIVAMFALIQVLLGRRVDILTSSKILAERDAEENKPLFELFKVSVSNNCDKACEDEKVRAKRYKENQVIYGEIGYFQGDLLQTEFYEAGILGGRKADCVVVDEVDSMLLDKGDNMLYLSHAVPDLQYLRQLFVEIWLAVNDPNLFGTEEDKTLIINYIKQRCDSNELLTPKYLTAFIDYRLPIWIENAFLAKQLEQNDSFVFSQHADANDDITVVDKDTGVEQLSTRWSNGLHQFLQLRYNRPLTAESLKSVFISNFDYINRYKGNVYGVTGTLGSEKELSLLSTAYQFDYFNLPRFKLEQFYEEEAKLQNEEERWLTEIVSIVRDMQAKNRAILLICENIVSAETIAKKLKTCQAHGCITEPYVSAFQKFDFIVKPGQWIVATNLAGRGTDLKVADEVNEKGGLHVLLTYLPSNIRIEKQAFGRTARNGNKGSGQFVIYNPDESLLSIEALKQLRDKQENERLSHIEKRILPKIKLEEKLFNNFQVLYAEVRAYFEKMNGCELDYKQQQLHGLETQWAFWLDQQEPQLKSLNTVGEQSILKGFEDFKNEVWRQVEKSNITKLIKGPSERVRLGLFFQAKNNEEHYKNALECFNKVIKKEPVFSAPAHYYQAACLLAQGDSSDKNKRREARQALQKAQLRLNQQVDLLRSSAEVLKVANAQRQEQGLAVNANAYQKDIEEFLKTLGPHMRVIESALGNTIEPSLFINETKGVHDEIAQKIWEELRRNDAIFKNYRLSKKIEIAGDQLCGYAIKHEGQQKLIQLPAHFSYAAPALRKLLASKYGNIQYWKDREIEANMFEACVMEQSVFWQLLLESAFIVPNIKPALEKERLQEMDFGQFGKYQKTIISIFSRKNMECFTQNNFTQLAGIYNDFHKFTNHLALYYRVVTDKISAKAEILNKIFDDLSLSAIKEAALSLLQRHVNKLLPIKQLVSIYPGINETALKKFINLLEQEEIVTGTVVYYTIAPDRLSETKQIFQKRYPDFDFNKHLDDFAKEQELQLFDEHDLSLPQSKAAGAQSLFQYFLQEKVIKAVGVNIALDPAAFENQFEIIEAELNKVSIIKDSVKDAQAQKEYLNNLSEMLKSAMGTLSTMPDIKVSYEELSKFFETGELPPTIYSVIEQALAHVLKFEEKKSWWDWGAFAVAMLGVAQIIAGVLLEVCTLGAATYFASALISEGIGDMMFAIEAGLTGTFSWKEYGINKAISMAISLATGGVGAWLSRGVKVAKTSLVLSQSIRRRVMTKCVEATAFGLANVGIDKILEQVMTAVGDKLTAAVSNLVSSALDDTQRNAWVTKLQALFETYGQEKLQQMMQEIMAESLAAATHKGIKSQAMDYSLQAAKGLLDNVSTAIGHLDNAGHVGGKLNFLKKIAKVTNALLNGIRVDRRSDPRSTARTGGLYMAKSFYELATLAKNIHAEFDKRLTAIVLKNTMTNQANSSNQGQEFCNNIINELNHKIDECFAEQVKATLISPQLKSYAHQALKGMGHMTRKGYYSALDTLHDGKTFRQHLEGIKYKLKGAQPVASDSLVNVHGNKPVKNAKGATVKELIGQYGKENLKFYQSKDGTLHVQRPSFHAYVDMIKQGKPAGRLELQLLADTKAKAIVVVDHNDLNQVKERIAPDENRKHGVEHEFRVALIPNADGIGHYVPCVKVNDTWQMVENLPVHSSLKNGCLYQSVSFLEQYNHEVSKHKKDAKASSHEEVLHNVKNSAALSEEHLTQGLHNLANTFQNDFKYRRLHRRKFQEHSKELVGGSIVATWNSQGAGGYDSINKASVRSDLMRAADITLLQESGNFVPNHYSFNRLPAAFVNGINLPANVVYGELDFGTTRTHQHYYALHYDDGRTSLSMLSHAEPRNLAYIPGIHRPMIGMIMQGGEVMFNMHAISGRWPLAPDAPHLLREAENYAAIRRRGFNPVLVGGDFNSDPGDVFFSMYNARLANQQLGRNVPIWSISHANAATRPASRRELDFFAHINIPTAPIVNVLNHTYASDHFPVVAEFN